MTYFGDFPVSGVVDLKFTSRQFSSGAPFLLAGSPLVRVYKSTGTTEDDSGITLTTNFDGVTGLNHVSIDLSADGTFYAAGSECQIVLTAGTVDGVSVAGETLGSFSIERAGAVLALAKSADGFAALKTQTAAIEVDTQDIQSRLPAALVSGRMDSSVGAMATNTITSGAVAASAVAELQSGLALEATLTSMKGATFDTSTDSLEAIRNRGDSAWITATGFSTLDASGVRAAVGLSSANLDAQLTSLDSKSDGIMAAVGVIDSNVDLIKVTTDKIDTTMALDGAAYQFTANALDLAPTGGSAPSAAEIRIEMDTNSTKLADILTDTGTTIPGTISTLQTATAAIKAKTDNLIFTVTGQVDANAESMNGAEILGDGTAANLWRGE